MTGLIVVYVSFSFHFFGVHQNVQGLHVFRAASKVRGFVLTVPRGRRDELFRSGTGLPNFTALPTPLRDDVKREAKSCVFLGEMCPQGVRFHPKSSKSSTAFKYLLCSSDNRGGMTRRYLEITR